MGRDQVPQYALISLPLRANEGYRAAQVRTGGQDVRLGQSPPPCGLPKLVIRHHPGHTTSRRVT
jgi:hypothetical protein